MKKRKSLHRKGKQNGGFSVTNYNYHESSECFYHFLKIILFFGRWESHLLLETPMRVEVAGIVKAVRARLFELGDVSLDGSQNWST